MSGDVFSLSEQVWWLLGAELSKGRNLKMGQRILRLSIGHAALGTPGGKGKGGGLQLRAHSKEEVDKSRGLVARPASQWAHARKPKAWQRPRSCELRPEPRFPCRRAGHPHAGPQSEAGSRPFQSLPAICNVNPTLMLISLSLADCWDSSSVLHMAAVSL